MVEQATGLTRLAGFAGKPQDKVLRLMRKLYDSQHGRIIFLGEKATVEFWDRRWQVQDLRQFILGRKDPWLVGITRRYLSPGARVLEGGCGRGDKVHALQMNGFVAFGMDYAEHTVKTINRCMPELKVVCGDLRHIPFGDGFFDGYWSLGVIEHFFDGYEPILAEMRRVLRSGGYLFLTFPCMSLLRRAKARFGLYGECAAVSTVEADFYQFALDSRVVTRGLEEAGFTLVRRESCEGILGLKEDVAVLASAMNWIDKGQCFWAKALGRILEPVTRPWANHDVLLVLRKR